MPSRGELGAGGQGDPIGFALLPRRRRVPVLADAEAPEFAAVARDHLNELIRKRLSLLEPALTHVAQSAYEDQRAEEVAALGPLPRYMPGKTRLREKQHDWTTGRRRKRSGEIITSSREVAGSDGIVHPVVINHHIDRKGAVVMDSYEQKWPLRNGAHAELKFTMNQGRIGMVEFNFQYRGDYGAFNTTRGSLYDQVFAPYWGPREESKRSWERDSREDVAARAKLKFPENLYFNSQQFQYGHIQIALILGDQPSNTSPIINNHYAWMNSQGPHHVGPQVLIDNVQPHDYMSSTGHYGFNPTVGKEGVFSVLSSKSGRDFYKQDDFGASLSVPDFLNVLDRTLDLAAVVRTDPMAIAA